MIWLILIIIAVWYVVNGVKKNVKQFEEEEKEKARIAKREENVRTLTQESLDKAMEKYNKKAKVYNLD